MARLRVAAAARGGNIHLVAGAVHGSANELACPWALEGAPPEGPVEGLHVVAPQPPQGLVELRVPAPSLQGPVELPVAPFEQVTASIGSTSAATPSAAALALTAASTTLPGTFAYASVVVETILTSGRRPSAHEWRTHPELRARFWLCERCGITTPSLCCMSVRLSVC